MGRSDALRTKDLVVASLFSALMIVGAYIKVPIGPVPIVLTNLFVLLAGAVLTVRWAMTAVGIYLFLGLIGFPVFAAGAGPAYFIGPTGGYLLGYLPAAAAVSVMSGRGRFRDLAALIIGIVLIYAAGVPWLKVATGLTWPRAFAAGMAPFLIGDALKVAAAYAVSQSLSRAFPELLPGPARVYGPGAAAPEADTRAHLVDGPGAAASQAADSPTPDTGAQ